jgi:RNA polymerase sigma-70 factor (ECF subfamily)
VRRYLRKALAVALEYMRTLEDAEDVVQDTFGRVLENLQRYDPARRFEPWFFTILRNTARNAARFRQLRQHEQLAAEHASDAAGPFEQASRSELQQRIDAALDALPMMQRACFRLCTVEGLTSAEAGRALGLAESTVRVHVYKAKRVLQERLGIWRDEVKQA